MLAQEEPIRTKRLHEHVTERLKALIIERHMKPGDKLPSERELQTMFGIGRPAVREALLKLQHGGLIAMRSGKPATVAHADPRNILNEARFSIDHFLTGPNGVKELQAARRLLECGIANHAAENCTEEDLAALRGTLERAETALDDTQAFENEDLAFHYALVKTTNIRLFEVLFQALAGWLREQRSLPFSLPGQSLFTLREHRAIYNAIASRDPVAALNAMDAHMAQAELTYWTAREARETRKKNRKNREK